MRERGTAPAHGSEPARILERLRELRRHDAPTHGGRLLSYVYDSGVAELDALAGDAARIAQSLNGLDPTAFPSIAAMERDVVAFVRRALRGEHRGLGGLASTRVVGSVTSGGTESCLLAVKTARDLWRAAHPDAPIRPRLLTTTAAHAAFRKAAHLFDLTLDQVPCQPDGSARAADLIERMADDVALVVVSAPSYPSGQIDPIAAVSRAAQARGLACHVDACFGGMALPWWPEVPPWDFRLPGVTSISADLHKFGYAPKGVSVLLHRGRARHRAQFFATTRWAAYPVVNPTLLGSRSASPLAAAWAITRRLGAAGYRELTASCVRATHAVASTVDGISGLRVQGSPVGPAIALVSDDSVPKSERVDPHRLADAMLALGFRLQHQPGFTQSNGAHLPHTAHLTITPATEGALPELCTALRRAADEVRGQRQARAPLAIAALRALGYHSDRVPSPAAARAILRLAGVGPTGTPTGQATLMALIEGLPAAVAEALLCEVLAWASEP